MSLTTDRLRNLLHYNCETGLFTWRAAASSWVKVGDKAGSFDADGYVQIGIDGARHKAHRLAWLYVYGEWPHGELDHKDRDRSNNRVGNLRIATRSEQLQNSRARCASQFRGVYWFAETGRWVAKGKIGGCCIHLGYFTDMLDAVAARIRFERKNFPRSEFA